MKFSEIISANRLLAEELHGPKFSIAILSNIMVHQSKDICEFLLRSESLNAEVTLGDYDNVIQDSEKFKNSDAVVISFAEHNASYTSAFKNIFDCLNWCIKIGPNVIGGKNISIVHDKWGTLNLRDKLKKNFNMYKLRRYKN